MTTPMIGLRRACVTILLILSLGATDGCKKESNANGPGATAPAPPSGRSAAVPSLDDEAISFVEALVANHMTKTGVTYSFVDGDPSNATSVEIRTAGKPVTYHFTEDPGALGTVPGGARITEADKLNGIEWHGRVALDAITFRTGSNRNRTVKWDDWNSAGSGSTLDITVLNYAHFEVEKRSGQWICKGPMGGWGSMRPSATASEDRGPASVAQARGSRGLNDSAHFFSDAGRQTAARMIERIHEQQDRDLLIETFESLPAGKSVCEYANDRMIASKVNGAYAVVVRKGGRVCVIGSEGTSEVFKKSGTAELAQKLEKDLHVGPKNLDVALINFIGSVDSTVLRP